MGITKDIAAPWEGATSDRAAWLAWRRGSVGASEVAAVMGLDPYRSAWAVWMDKRGLAPEEDTAPEACWWGLRDEPAILERYTITTNRAIVRTQVAIRHAELPLHATLDAVDDTGRVIEAKSTTRLSGLGDEGSDQLPDSWLVQAQAQMMCAGVDAVTFAVRSGHRLRLFEVQADADLQREIAASVRGFWALVESGEEPAIDPRDVARWATAHPDFDDEPAPAGPEVESQVREYERACEVAKVAEEAKARAKAAVFQALNGRAAVLGDGRIVRRQTIEVRERTQTIAAHTQYRLTIAKVKGGGR